MPWLEPDFPQSVIDANLNHQVAQWPQPNTNRIDARFRHLYGLGWPAPRASRWMFRLSPVNHVAIPIFNGWLDLVAISDTVLEGVSGPDPDEGWDIKLTITNYIAPVVDPDFGKSGIGMRWTVTYPGEPDWSYWIMFDKDAAEWVDGIPYDIFQVFNDPIALYDDDKDPILNPSWSTVPPFNFAFLAMSECWLFPPLTPPEGSAAFNNNDAWIDFPTWYAQTNGAFKWELTYKPLDLFQQVILGTHDWPPSFTGFSGLNNIRWWNDLFGITPMTLGTWYDVRLERDWSIPGPGVFSCWIDGNFEFSASGSPTQVGWCNQLGKRGSTIEGSFELKNMKTTIGSPGSPNLIMDLPLTIDACDLATTSQKGTTFAMTLPSCP